MCDLRGRNSCERPVAGDSTEIMRAMQVATLGLLPAALPYAIRSDSRRPFAIMIVGGLIVDPPGATRGPGGRSARRCPT